MIDFWLVSVVLVVIALGFVIYPLVRNKQKRIVLDRRTQNIAAFKYRLAEITAEHQAGSLTEDQYEDLKVELEASLLVDVEGLEHDAEPSDGNEVSKKNTPAFWGLAAALIISVPLLSYGLYDRWGALDGVEQLREWGNAVPQVDQGMPKQDIEQLLQKLRDKLEANPDNADGWFMLGRSSMNLQKYDQASYAFLKMAALLEKQDEDPSAIYGLAAQALFFAENGQMTDGVKEILNKAFAINPDETNGLGLLGIDAFENGRYEDAIKYWSRILEVEPDSPSAEAIASGIERARVAWSQAGGPKVPNVPNMATADIGSVNTENSNPSQADAVPGAEIKVLVELDPGLVGKASPDDTLFIFAKAVNGSPMPLAASRQKVSDLPVLVTLNDAMAMGPMAKISSVKEVTVVARISKSGTPGAKAGDLEGGMSPVKVGSPNVIRVLISEEVN